MSTSPKPRFFRDAAAFRRWLEKNSATARELLVGFHKVGTGRPSLTWSESVDEALCFGWIDGLRRRLDDDAYSIRFTPRRPGSTWSAINLAKVEALSAQGRMRPAGLAAFARRTEARSRVYSYENRAEAAFTAAETKRFRIERAAWAFWNAQPEGWRCTVTYWVASAKLEATRARRLEKLIAACREGKRL